VEPSGRDRTEEISMAERHKGRSADAYEEPDTAVAEAEELNPDADQEEAPVVVASARSIPRPATSLTSRIKGDVGKLTVCLLGDPASVLSLEDVRKINTRPDTAARTPMMTVIQAVLAHGGGTMKLAELTEKVRDLWNRPFPCSPYTTEEFVYIMVQNSDDISVSE
jgi:hypothetical protein